MTATRNTRPIYHDDDYPLANDVKGDEIAAKRHLWADRDLNYCLFGWLIILHWADLREGWFYKGKRVTRNAHKIPLWKVLRLVSRHGHRIRTVGRAMRDAKKLGVPGYEFDLKFVPSQRQFNRLARAARRVWGPGWQKHVEVKIWYRMDWRTACARAKKAGIKSTVIRYPGDPADLPEFVDRWRP